MIDNKKALANGDGFQCSSSSASSDNYDDELSNESLLKKLCAECFSVCLRIHQNVPQDTKNYYNLLGEHAPTPPPALYTRSRMLLLDQVVGQRQPLWQRRLYETVQGFQTQSDPLSVPNQFMFSAETRIVVLTIHMVQVR